MATENGPAFAYEVWAEGPGGKMTWTQPQAGTITDWLTKKIIIRPGSWMVTQGSFDAIIANVTLLKIRVRMFDSPEILTQIGLDSVKLGDDAINVPPSRHQITLGTDFGGTLASLASSDDDSVYVLCDESNPTGRIVFTATSPVLNPTKFKFTMESGVSRTALVEYVDAFDYLANGWVNVGVSQASMNDVRKTFTMTGNLNRFIRPSDATIGVRVTHIPSEDLVAEDGWTTRFDEFDWRLWQ